MRWLARIFATALARRVAVVIVAALLAWAGIGRAEAACTVYNGNAWRCDYKDEAYAKAIGHTLGNGTQVCDYYRQQQPQLTWHENGAHHASVKPGMVYEGVHPCANSSAPTNTYGNDFVYAYFLGECPAGKFWNAQTNKCDLTCPGGYTEDPYNLGQCLDADKCTARNAELGSNAPRVGKPATQCKGGCQYKVSGPFTAVDGWVTGTWEYSGASCAATPPAPEDKEPVDEQVCSQNGSFRECVKPNGEHCLSGAAGRQLCWKPGETGEKTDGPVKQKRDAGTTEIPPNLNLPNGDTLQKQGDSKTTTTTTTTNNQTTTITTTTTNYVTQHGTNAGPTQQGEADDGTGGEGGEEQQGSASGGGDCAAPPAMTGDPLLMKIAEQNWLVRCGTSKADANGDGRPDWTEITGDGSQHWNDGNGTGAGEPTAGDVKGERTHGAQGFDDSGFGWGSTCPEIPQVEVFGHTINLDAGGVFCDWMTLGGWFVLLVAGLACLRILWNA